MKVRKKDFEVRKNLSFAPWIIHISSGENLNLLKKLKKGVDEPYFVVQV